MKIVKTITFHSSYNLGSNLQAYALQEFVKKLDSNIDYKIINYRTKVQKEMYRNPFEFYDIKNNIKKLLLIGYKKQFLTREQLYEEFINKTLNVTNEYNSYTELVDNECEADYFISGSDQLWNLRAKDFDWAYFLEFVKSGKKISYAASFGPKKIDFSELEKARIKKALHDYKSISVREEKSKEVVEVIADLKSEISMDPTILLSKNEWLKVANNNRLIKEDYILLYDLSNKEEVIKIANYVSKKLKLPVVIPNFKNIRIHLTSGYIKKYDCGPREFLNLINNANLVLSSSFHGTIFSVIFRKPFFAINGINDFRINTLLKRMNLEDRSITISDMVEKVLESYKISFENVEKIISEETEKSEKYLKSALDIR